MAYYLSVGLALGLAAGLSPGPLLTLVISETMQHGMKAGTKVALAPIITDAPIILLMLFATAQLSNFDNVVGVISLIGACYVLYLALDTARVNEPTKTLIQPKSQSIYKGVITNALSPHPYIFWLTIGAPTITKSLDASAVAPVLFVFGFYLPLVGAKLLLAWLTGKYGNLFAGSSYRNVMWVLSILLVIFAILLFIDGLELLGFRSVM